MSRKVIQVPIEEELLAALDVRSQEEGRSRAEIIQEACRAYLREQDQGQEGQGYQRPDQRPQEIISTYPEGTPAFVGAWADVSDEEIDKFIADIYAARERDTGRPVELEP